MSNHYYYIRRTLNASKKRAKSYSIHLQHRCGHNWNENLRKLTVDGVRAECIWFILEIFELTAERLNQRIHIYWKQRFFGKNNFHKFPFPRDSVRAFSIARISQTLTHAHGSTIIEKLCSFCVRVRVCVRIFSFVSCHTVFVRVNMLCEWMNPHCV